MMKNDYDFNLIDDFIRLLGSALAKEEHKSSDTDIDSKINENIEERPEDSIEKEFYDLIDNYFSDKSEKYKDLIKGSYISKAKVLEDIASNIRQEVEEEDEVQEIINKLKNGEALHLEEELMEKVINKLWETENKCQILVKNNLIELK